MAQERETPFGEPFDHVTLDLIAFPRCQRLHDTFVFPQRAETWLRYRDPTQGLGFPTRFQVHGVTAFRGFDEFFWRKQLGHRSEEGASQRTPPLSSGKQQLSQKMCIRHHPNPIAEALRFKSLPHKPFLLHAKPYPTFVVLKPEKWIEIGDHRRQLRKTKVAQLSRHVATTMPMGVARCSVVPTQIGCGKERSRGQ